jgi:protein-tyrosine phosphatase
MLKLFSKRNKEQKIIDYSHIKTDMHSHLLPGIDDGVADMATSMECIRGLKNLGYSKLITTPHIFWDLYKNTPDLIKEKENEVLSAIEKNGIDIEFKAAAEYFLDEHFSHLLKKKERLLTLSGNKILVEFSMAYRSLAMTEILFDIQMAGYQPVVAHPERYTYLYKNWDVFYKLKETGCLYQMNLLSLSGSYGKIVKEIATYLLENNLYSIIGTDLHHEGHLERLKKVTLTPQLQSFLDSKEFLNSTL